MSAWPVRVSFVVAPAGMSAPVHRHPHDLAIHGRGRRHREEARPRADLRTLRGARRRGLRIDDLDVPRPHGGSPPD